MSSTQADALTSVQLGVLTTVQLAVLTSIPGVTTATLAAPYVLLPNVLSGHQQGNWASVLFHQPVIKRANPFSSAANMAAALTQHSAHPIENALGGAQEGSSVAIPQMVQALHQFDENGAWVHTPISRVAAHAGASVTSRLLAGEEQSTQGNIALGQ